MRHGKKNNHLGRTASHRKSLLSNMANSLILSKRIVTTVAKAKELRKYVEPLLTKSKEDTTHNRRIVFSYLKSKESIKTLFGEVSEKIANRNGGYTRIIKLGTRSGDAAETAMIELVDYNDILLSVKSEQPAKSRRTRRAGSKKADDVSTPLAAATASSIVSDAVVVDETPEVSTEEIQETTWEAPSEEIETTPEAEASEEAAPEAEASSSEEESPEAPENPSEEEDSKPE
jgi:large subunit ribosomal protein L17